METWQQLIATIGLPGVISLLLLALIKVLLVKGLETYKEYTNEIKNLNVHLTELNGQVRTHMIRHHRGASGDDSDG